MALSNKIRRLKNMRIFHVSLVDKPANKRTFLLQKKKGEDTMDDVQVKKVEKALNNLFEQVEEMSTELAAVKKSLADNKEMIVIEKVGATFSKGTLGILKDVVAKLNALIGKGDPTDNGTETKKVLTDEEAKKYVQDEIAKGMAEAFVDKGKETDEAKKKVDEALNATVAKAVTTTLAELEKKKKEETSK